MANGPGKYNYLISGLQVRILLGAPIKRSKEMDKFKIGDESGAATHYFKKAGDSIYEDQWHLNDGKVEIPDDADKLEKDGSVVAFRKRKVKPFEFGEKLRIKKSLWLISIEANPGFDYVNAVYLSKYFGLEDDEGIKVYIDDGEEGWECCFIGLSKVERLG
mgnify:CR=1 FL=1